MATTNNIAMLKSLLGITDAAKDLNIEFILNSAEEVIMNYCHIEAVPVGLNNTMLRMAADMYRNDALGSVETPQRVTSVSRGDISTSFGDLPTDYTTGLLKNYEKALASYRKLAF